MQIVLYEQSSLQNAECDCRYGYANRARTDLAKSGLENNRKIIEKHSVPV